MKASLVIVALVASLIFANPAYTKQLPPAPVTSDSVAIPSELTTPQPSAANIVPVPPDLAALQNSALWQAYMAVINDLKPILNQDNIKSRLEHLDGFEFSPETKKKLFDLFGNENPLHLRFKKHADGNSELSFNLDSLDHQDPNTGSKAHTSAVTGKALYNKRYTKAHVAASMPSFGFDSGKTTKLTGNDLGLVSDQTSGHFGMWFGTANFTLGKFAIDDSKADVHVTINDMSVSTSLKQHESLVDVDYSFSIKSINWGSDEVGPVHMAFRLANIDGKKLGALTEEAKKLDQTKQTDPEKIAALTVMFKEFGLATLTHGGAIDIKDISVQYHGNTARLNGRITFDNIQKSDFESTKLIGDKIGVRMNLSIPKAFATDLSRLFARQSLKATIKCCRQITDKEVNDKAKDDLAKAIEKLTQNKWIQIKRDTILSAIEFKAGKLLVNGQVVSLPAPATVSAPGQKPGYAEQIRDKIRRNIIVPPGTPANTSVTYSVIQLPDGTILSVTLKSSSGFALYEEAVARAIRLSTPLPLAPKPELFSRELILTFRPDNVETSKVP